MRRQGALLVRLFEKSRRLRDRAMSGEKGAEGAAEDFVEKIKESRFVTCLFNASPDIKEDRFRYLSARNKFAEGKKGVVYWMSRDCRVQDNWALLFAQKLAKENEVPLHVCFFAKPHKHLYPRSRHYKFLVEGLREVAEELSGLDVKFFMIDEEPNALAKIVDDNKIGAVVCEFFPLRKPQEWQKRLEESLPDDVAFVQVDAHNIVPAWAASDKLEAAARTIRPKIVGKLPAFLEAFPPVVRHPFEGDLSVEMTITLDDALEAYPKQDESEKLSWARGGTTPGLHMLHEFISKRLGLYGEHSSDPSKDALSHLSPWLRFGQISAQRCAIEVKKLEDQHRGSVKKFLEELIVRRELTDNFCYYNEHYDSIKGAKEWAQVTLKNHVKDKRAYLYSKENFESGKTHDSYWNAAQVQLLTEGKIHGYMRMYWAKKILEWAKTPEEALEIALYLNDTYSLDGTDPNGYVGVMWSICGIHDQGWKERPIFGKIRYMNDRGLERKYDIKEYARRYAGAEEEPPKKRKR